MPSRTEVKRLIVENTETLSGNATVSGNRTFSGAVTFSGTQLGSIVNTATTLTLAPGTHSGKVIFVTAASKTITLPAATTANIGENYTVVSGVANSAITIGVTGTDTINGGTSGKGLTQYTTIDAIGDAVTVMSNGSEWFTIAGGGNSPADLAVWKAES